MKIINNGEYDILDGLDFLYDKYYEETGTRPVAFVVPDIHNWTEGTFKDAEIICVQIPEEERHGFAGVFTIGPNEKHVVEDIKKMDPKTLLWIYAHLNLAAANYHNIK